MTKSAEHDDAQNRAQAVMGLEEALRVCLPHESYQVSQGPQGTTMGLELSADTFFPNWAQEEDIAGALLREGIKAKVLPDGPTVRVRVATTDDVNRLTDLVCRDLTELGKAALYLSRALREEGLEEACVRTTPPGLIQVDPMTVPQADLLFRGLGGRSEDLKPSHLDDWSDQRRLAEALSDLLFERIGCVPLVTPTPPCGTCETEAMMQLSSLSILEGLRLAAAILLIPPPAPAP
ncbi:hypothetical protein [Streptomyces sp. NPDC002690]